MKTSILFLMLVLFSISMANCSEDEVQEKSYLTLAAKDSVLYFANKAGVRQITINANIDWTVELLEGEVSWCSATPKLEDGKADKLRFDVEVNNEPEERSCTFIVKAEGMQQHKVVVSQLGVTPVLHLNYTPQVSNSKGDELRFNIVSNVDYTITQKVDWFEKKEIPDSRASVSTDYIYQIDANWSGGIRTDTIFIDPVDKNIKINRRVIIKQVSVDYDDVIPEDEKIKVTSVSLERGNTYGSENVDKTIDGDWNTNYSSENVPVGDSVIIDYTLEEGTDLVNYIRIVQRTDGNTGSIFDAGVVWYQNANSIDWEILQTFQVSRGADVNLNMNLNQPTKIRISLKNLVEGTNIAFAEAEFYELKSRDISADMQYFEDDVFSELKNGVTEEDISKIQNPVLRFLAQELHAGTYKTGEFRVSTFRGQHTPWKLSGDLKFGSQSHNDNPTGIFFVPGETYSVFLGKGAEAPVSLVVSDFRDGGKSQKFALQEGLNIIKPGVSGGGFIQYYTDEPRSLADVKIHFVFGHEMGYWDVKRGHTNVDYVRFLELAEECHSDLNHTEGFFSVCGRYSQLLNLVDEYKTWCPTDIESLMVQHDSILSLSYDLMGLTKNNVRPENNRKLSLRTWSGPPHWNGKAANFPNAGDYMLDVNKLGWWVFGHELGHGNQIKPHMHMAGWGECSNNLYSSYVMYKLGDDVKMERETIKRSQEDSENSVSGGRFNSYLNEAYVAKKPYLTQVGADYSAGLEDDKGNIQADHFVKLVPLWQLTVYFMIAGETNEWHRPDFWADVNWSSIEDDRTREDVTHGEGYMNFMKRAIDASGYDLSEFFANMGMLRVVNHGIADYGAAIVEITKADSVAVRAYGSQKAKINHAIQYISFNSIDAFKNKREVQGTFNVGVTDKIGSSFNGKTINHAQWRNVVAFETYSGEELVDVAMVGTGSPSGDNTSTYVRYPEGATRIEAVSYSGQRTLVFGVRL